jgi:hypothetical protein
MVITFQLVELNFHTSMSREIGVACEGEEGEAGGKRWVGKKKPCC